jgi:hypothetical protein
MDINRTQILEGFLSDIADIADKEYQRRIWIHAEGPECDDFTEIVCRYSNAAESIFEKYKEYGISDIQLYTCSTSKAPKANRFKSSEIEEKIEVNIKCNIDLDFLFDFREF